MCDDKCKVDKKWLGAETNHPFYSPHAPLSSRIAVCIERWELHMFHVDIFERSALDDFAGNPF